MFQKLKENLKRWLPCGSSLRLWFLMDREKKLLPCVFDADFLCVHRKTMKFTVMQRCLTCKYYLAFAHDMEEEESKFFEECDRIRKYGYPKSLGELGS